jgi:hypothetical protein
MAVLSGKLLKQHEKTFLDLIIVTDDNKQVFLKSSRDNLKLIKGTDLLKVGDDFNFTHVN